MDEFDDEYLEFYDDNEDIYNSSLYYESNIENEYDGLIFNNTALKNGIIIKVYEIDDEKNLNKKFPEYDVLIVEQKKNSTMEPVIYNNCISIDGFGGVADFFEYKLRPVKSEENKKSTTPLSTNFKEQFGSMVLLLCLDGSSDKGIIIKSVPHQGRKTNLTKDNDVHLEGEYNGLNWKINKDGELTVTFKSKTDEKGKPQDDAAGGTFVKIDKQGSIELDTADEAKLKIDKTSKDIVAEVGNNIDLTAKKDINATADGNIKGSAKEKIEFDAGGSAKYSSKSAFDIESKAKIQIKGQDVDIKCKNKIKIKALNTLIDSQANFIVKSPTIILGPASQPAVIPKTKFIGPSPFFGIPVVVQAVGPFSKSVFVSE
jgi:hypothetical protein